MKPFSRQKILLLAALFLPLTVLQANPGFSRQMGMECMACHNQTMTQLNSFGRKFSASGFTMTSGIDAQMPIEGDPVKLGLPSVLNASVLLKARYVKKETEVLDPGEPVGKERGSVELFKVSKIFFGGKIAENVGGFLHLDYDSIGGKITYSDQVGTGYWGITAYTDENFGPFAGMEYYNTGLLPPMRLFDNRKGTNAAQATDLAHGAATGAQIYYGGDELFFMAGAYIPAASKHEGLDVGSSFIPITRIAYAPTFGEWTVMLGAYYLNGTATLSDAALNNTEPKIGVAELVDIKRIAYGVDMQIEGNIAGASTVLTLQSVMHNKTDIFDSNIPGYTEKLVLSDAEYKAGENKAFSAELQVNPWAALGIKTAYLHMNDNYIYDGTITSDKYQKFDRDEYSFGLDYSFRQNVRFAAEYTYTDSRLETSSDSEAIYLYTMIGF